MKSLAKYDYIQIGGNFKSGTSLLLSLLDNHPEIISFPEETGNTGYLLPKLTRPDKPFTEKVELIARRCTDTMLGDTSRAKIGEIFRSLARDSDGSVKQLHFLFTMAAYLAFESDINAFSHVWIDKSPISHKYADKLFKMFPNMKFIHLIREPKNNLASALGGVLKKGKSKLYAESILWLYRITAAQSLYYAQINQQKYGSDRYMILKFEDLLSSPQETMEKLCGYIGIDVHDCLYKPTKMGFPYKGNNKEGKHFNGIDNLNIDRWRERMPLYYGKAMETIPSELIIKNGYKIQFSSRERAMALLKHRVTPKSAKKRLKSRWGEDILEKPAPGIPGVNQGDS